MAGGWIKKFDASGKLISTVREEDARLIPRRSRFEKGFVEVWTDDFDKMYEIIRHETTCPLIGMSLVPKLMRLMEFDTGEIEVDQSDLAESLGVSRQELNRTLREFVDLGLLEVVGKRSRHNVYRLPERVVWKGRPEKRLKVVSSNLKNPFSKSPKKSSQKQSKTGSEQGQKE
jgi:predicted transcriptional regulator